MRDTPVRDSRLIKVILASVSIGSSFCKPSRGPTSRRVMASGSAVIAVVDRDMAESADSPVALDSSAGSDSRVLVADNRVRAAGSPLLVADSPCQAAGHPA